MSQGAGLNDALEARAEIRRAKKREKAARVELNEAVIDAKKRSDCLK